MAEPETKFRPSRATFFPLRPKKIKNSFRRFQRRVCTVVLVFRGHTKLYKIFSTRKPTGYGPRGLAAQANADEKNPGKVRGGRQCREFVTEAVWRERTGGTLVCRRQSFCFNFREQRISSPETTKTTAADIAGHRSDLTTRLSRKKNDRTTKSRQNLTRLNSI